MTNLWSSARERELTKIYNAELRARHTDTATVRCCKLTIIFWQHLTCSPDGAAPAGAPPAASPPGTPLLPELAHPAQTERVTSRKRQARHGHP